MRVPVKQLTEDGNNYGRTVAQLTLPAEPVDRLRELRDLPARIPELRREAVGELLAQGWTRSQIARELGISRQAVQEWGAPVARASTDGPSGERKP